MQHCLVHHQTMSLSVTSRHLFNSSMDRDFSTSIGCLFQDFKILSVHKFFLISNLNLPCYNLRLFPIVLLLGTWEKRPISTWTQPPLREMQRVIRFPLSLLFFRLDPHSCFSSDLSSIPFTGSTALSGHAPALQCVSCYEATKKWTQNSSCGCTSEEHRVSVYKITNQIC